MPGMTQLPASDRDGDLATKNMKDVLDSALQTVPSLVELQHHGLEGEVSEKQLKVAHITHTSWWQCLIASMILVNMMTVVIHTDASARNEDAALWVFIIDQIVLAVFVVELATRLFLLRCHFWSCAFNVLDFVVVFLDVVVEVLSWASADLDMSGLTFLRAARLGRLTRAYRVMVLFPMLSVMCRDLLGAMQAVCWGCILLLIVLTAWSIVAVQFIHPLVKELADQNGFGDCERCSRAFSSVLHSNLTLLQQTVAMDNWGVITVPMIEAYPWTVFFFVPVFVSVCLAIMNVILAVIVESAAESRKNDLVEVMKVKEHHYSTKSKELLRVCKSLDLDGSGEISLQELMTGFESHLELSILLQDMGIDQDDLSTVFQIMDTDHSGQVNYAEFVKHIYKMRTADQHTMLAYIRHYVVETHRDVGNLSRKDGDNVDALPASEIAAQQADAIPPQPCLLVTAGDQLDAAGSSITAEKDIRIAHTAGIESEQIVQLSSLCDAILACVKQDLAIEVRKVAEKCDKQIDLLETYVRGRNGDSGNQSQNNNSLLTTPDGRALANYREEKSVERGNDLGCVFNNCPRRV